MGGVRIRHSLGYSVRLTATRRSLQRQVIVGDAGGISACRSTILSPLDDNYDDGDDDD